MIFSYLKNFFFGEFHSLVNIEQRPGTRIGALKCLSLLFCLYECELIIFIVTIFNMTQPTLAELEHEFNKRLKVYNGTNEVSDLWLPYVHGHCFIL